MQLKHNGFLLNLLGCTVMVLYSCQLSPEEARRQLDEIGLEYNDKTFIESSFANDQSAVKLFLSAGINPNVKHNGFTSLMAAIQGHFEASVDSILYGTNLASVKIIRKDNLDRLLETVAILLNSGANIDEQDEHTLSQGDVYLSVHNTALIFSILGGNALSRSAFFVKKTNPFFNMANRADNRRFWNQVNGLIEIIEAILIDDQRNLVDFLLKHGANPNLRISNGKVALILATSKGYSQIVHSLLKNGAEIDAVDNEGNSDLIVALSNDRFVIADTLLGRGPDVRLSNKKGMSALKAAWKKDKYELCLDLITRGADHSQLSLWATIRGGHTALTDELFSRGEKLEARQIDKLLGYVCSDGFYEMAKTLLDKGADPNAFVGTTSVVYAVRGGHKDILELLLENGADLNRWTAMDGTVGEAALWVAASLTASDEGFDSDIVRLLIENGANVKAVIKRASPYDPEIAKVLKKASQ